MKKKTCFIVGAGSFDGMSIGPEKDDLIIAADGGYNYLKQMGIEPQVLMGDFDSLEVLPEHQNILRHSPIKDDTDMALAVAYAAEQGYRRFFLYGGLGGRLDHTMANLQLLNSMSRQGLESYLIGEKTVVTAITKERITFSAECSGMLSVFCMGEAAEGVWERGLKYQLTDAVMTCDRTLGVSNEFTGKESWIEVRKNTLQIVWDEKNGLPIKRNMIDSGRNIVEKTETAEKGEKTEAEKRAKEPKSSAGSEYIVSRSGWNAIHGEWKGEVESETYADRAESETYQNRGNRKEESVDENRVSERISDEASE